jgi:hypothetical protein
MGPGEDLPRQTYHASGRDFTDTGNRSAFRGTNRASGASADPPVSSSNRRRGTELAFDGRALRRELGKVHSPAGTSRAAALEIGPRERNETVLTCAAAMRNGPASSAAPIVQVDLKWPRVG